MEDNLDWHEIDCGREPDPDKNLVFCLQCLGHVEPGLPGHFTATGKLAEMSKYTNSKVTHWAEMPQFDIPETIGAISRNDPYASHSGQPITRTLIPRNFANASQS